MAWQLKWGQHADGLAARHEARNLPIPEHLFSPELQPAADFYLEAFWELATDRPVGFAAGSIPFSSIDRYAARFGIDDPDEFHALLRSVRACDSAWLKATATKPEGPG